MLLVRLIFILVISMSHVFASEIVIDDSPVMTLNGPLSTVINQDHVKEPAEYWFSQSFSNQAYETSLQQGPHTSWYKIKLLGHFADEHSHKRIINIQTHVLTHLHFYLYENGKLIKHKNLGLAHREPNNDESYKGVNFEFTIKNKQAFTLLIEKQSNGPSVLPMTIYNESSHSEFVRFQDSFWASVISVLLAMAFFNVLIYAMHPSKTYIWYLVFHLTGFLYFSGANGFGFKIWPESIQILLSQNAMFLGTMMIYFGLHFFYSFLDCEKNAPKYVKFFLPLRVITLIFAATNLIFYEYQTMPYFGPFQFLISIFAVYVGFIAFNQGYKPAKYYLISWVFPLTGALIDIGYSTNLLPANFLTIHGFLFGTLIELFLLSIALASRIKHAENTLLNQLYIYPDTQVANFSYLKTELPKLYPEIGSRLEHPFVIIADLAGFKEVASLYGPNALTKLYNSHTLNISNFLKNKTWSVPFPMPNGEDTYLISLPSEQVMCLINLPKDGIDITLSEVMSQMMEESDGLLTSKEFNSQIRITLGCAEVTEDIESAYRQAQVALLISLRQKNKWALYSHDHEKSISERTLIVHELQEALEEQHLKVFIQPKFNLSDESLIGGEALIRWPHRNFGEFSPGLFIPLAEQSGMVFQITQYVITSVFKWIGDLNKQNMLEMPFNISINLSALDLSEQRLTPFIASRLEFYNIESKWITFEITESAAQDNPAQIIQTVKVLKLLGFTVSIDDFGTGFSSMVYLQNIEPDEIKIDIAFTRNIHIDKQKQHIVKAIVELARSSNSKTIAEGIETRAELEHIKGIDCDGAQGHFWCPAISFEEFEEKYLQNKKI
ncbi:hypothetical protein NBRC116188_15130 [Oceaniserpentilla sp. 4NH20-0058]|uniref:EAL domain-containing protein n=1 Tax=Oceaniserpentilla sp. 4NH20-0058 TaxID=3127660 RepID=UPI00310617E5